MSRRRFRFHGLTFSQVTKLSRDEFIDMLPARRRRSLKRNQFWTPERRKLVDNIRQYQEAVRAGNDPKPIRTHVRDMIILPEMIGTIIEVYNGKQFVRVELDPPKIGHVFGEFSPSTKIVGHGDPGHGATRSSLYVPLK